VKSRSVILRRLAITTGILLGIALLAMGFMVFRDPFTQLKINLFWKSINGWGPVFGVQIKQPLSAKPQEVLKEYFSKNGTDTYKILDVRTIYSYEQGYLNSSAALVETEHGRTMIVLRYYAPNWDIIDYGPY